MSWASATDGCEIYYEEQGAGPVVVFVSGFMGIADLWRHQIDALRDRYRTIAFDNRGYGHSEKPQSSDAYSMQQHAADLEAVLDAADVDGPVVLVSHSMGGNIASTFALARPERVAGIVYVGTYLSGTQLRDLGGSVQALVGSVATPSAGVKFYRSMGLPEPIALEAAKWPLYALAANAQAHVSYDISERYPDITVPTLIVHGEGDVATPVEPCATAAEALLPDSRLEVLPDVKHFPQAEAPHKTTHLIEEHLEHCFARVRR
ncbi:alpha/beta fold hydrolase [Streptomyces sp. NPDC055681]